MTREQPITADNLYLHQ